MCMAVLVAMVSLSRCLGVYVSPKGREDIQQQRHLVLSDSEPKRNQQVMSPSGHDKSSAEKVDKKDLRIRKGRGRRRSGDSGVGEVIVDGSLSSMRRSERSAEDLPQDALKRSYRNLKRKLLSRRALEDDWEEDELDSEELDSGYEEEDHDLYEEGDESELTEEDEDYDDEEYDDVYEEDLHEVDEDEEYDKEEEEEEEKEVGEGKECEGKSEILNDYLTGTVAQLDKYLPRKHGFMTSQLINQWPDQAKKKLGICRNAMSSNDGLAS